MGARSRSADRDRTASRRGLTSASRQRVKMRPWPSADRSPQVRRLVVRDRHPRVSGGNPVRQAHQVAVDRRDGRQRGAPVGVRRGPHRHRGAAVSDRLSDHQVGGGVGGHAVVSARLSEPGGAPEPERTSAEPSRAGRGAADDEPDPIVAIACGERLRGDEGAVPRLFCEHSVRVVHEQRHCGLRGLLRERVLFLLRGVGTRYHGGGQQQPRSPGHGGARGRAYLSVRVQGGGAFAGGIGDGAIAGEGLCGEGKRSLVAWCRCFVEVVVPGRGPARGPTGRGFVSNSCAGA